MYKQDNKLMLIINRLKKLRLNVLWEWMRNFVIRNNAKGMLLYAIDIARAMDPR